MSIDTTYSVTQTTFSLSSSGSTAADSFMQAASKMVDDAIDKLPIDQATKDLLQAQFHASMGDVQGTVQNLNEFVKDLTQASSPRQTAEAQKSVDDAQKAIDSIMQQGMKQADDSTNEADSKGSSSANMSWVRALVKALGPTLDKLAKEMNTLAGQAKDSPSKAAEFQAVSQEFSLLMNTLTTAIKAIGEAQSTAARKQ